MFVQEMHVVQVVWGETGDATDVAGELNRCFSFLERVDLWLWLWMRSLGGGFSTFAILIELLVLDFLMFILIMYMSRSCMDKIVRSALLSILLLNFIKLILSDLLLSYLIIKFINTIIYIIHYSLNRLNLSSKQIGRI